MVERKYTMVSAKTNARFTVTLKSLTAIDHEQAVEQYESMHNCKLIEQR